MKTFLLFITLIGTNPAFSFSVDNHKVMSSIAVDAFNSCVIRIGDKYEIKPILPDEREKVIKGSMDEDQKHLLSRIINWHFYKNNNQMEKTIFFDSSNYTIFHKRIEQIKKLVTNNVKMTKQYYYLGHLTHHIQDMGVPAHVAPIFHSITPFAKDDTFEIRPISKEFIQNFKLSDEECEDLLADSHNDWYSILENVAEDTLISIEKDIPETNLTWKAFWIPYGERWFNPLKGFGHYGELGNTFGIYDGIKQEVYKEYFNQRLKTALIGTIKAYVKFQRDLH